MQYFLHIFVRLSFLDWNIFRYADVRIGFRQLNASLPLTVFVEFRPASGMLDILSC